MQNLAIDPQRLWDSLMDTARFGGTPKGGIRRLTLSEDDRKVRDWFAKAVSDLGCTLTIDEVGNMFAFYPGKRNDLAPIAMGSHLDTQPTGGKFDGCLGVMAGLEALRTLHDLGLQTEAPLVLINWTNEEGARFAPAMLGSGVYAGLFDRAYADSRADRDGVTFSAALENIGYRGPAPAGSINFQAFFELHIEQGPLLEAEQKDIGVVTGAQAIRWYELRLTGAEAHTGTTPMQFRRDALLGAAEIIQVVNAIALAHAPGVGTVGLIENAPNSRNVIPGQVFLTIDLRHPDGGALGLMQGELEKQVEQVASKRKLEAELCAIWDSPATSFNAGCIAAVRQGATAAGLSFRDIVSGAGHDAVYLARVVPTAMIFVPCAGGLSHNEAESSTLDECAKGAQVLLNAVLAYDAARTDG